MFLFDVQPEWLNGNISNKEFMSIYVCSIEKSCQMNDDESKKVLNLIVHCLKIINFSA